MHASPLSERLTDWHAGLSVDSAARLVKNVALTGRDSRNGYRYSPEALRGALPLYDQKPVFLDHAPDRARPHERSTRDLVGTIVNPRFEADRIRADIRVLDTESGRTFLALSTSNAPGVGMSHVVLARRSTDGETIESIEDVISVDAVVNPATTTTFRESTDTPSDSAASSSTDADAGHDSAANNPAPLAAESTGEEPLPPFTDLAALTAEVQDLRRRLDALIASREQEVPDPCTEALLNHARLPDFAVTPQFRRQLQAAVDDHARRSLIDERLTLLRRATRQTPQSLSRRSRDAPADTTADFLAAVKHR